MTLRPNQMHTHCGVAETLHGTPIGPHEEALPSGMQKDYVVLTAEERAKGFVEPVRRTYRHLKCGTTTIMGQALSETYARCPTFYSGTFCCTCGSHFPVGEKGEFVWDGTNQKVGTTRKSHAFGEDKRMRPDISDALDAERAAAFQEIMASVEKSLEVAPVEREGELWRCKECGARWAKWATDGSWSLIPNALGKAECGKCCDNVAMPR
jgi:hypothetical protein